MATQLQEINEKLIQNPNQKDILQLIMCDADLDSLGRKDFFTVNKNYRTELSNYNKTFTDKNWYNFQISFLENHNYFTNTSKKLRNKQKNLNLKIFKNKIKN